MLTEGILPLAQYFAYIEIADRGEEDAGGAPTSSKDLWRGYAALAAAAPNFAMKLVHGRADVYPVFRELFAKQIRKGVAS